MCTHPTSNRNWDVKGKTWPLRKLTPPSLTLPFLTQDVTTATFLDNFRTAPAPYLVKRAEVVPHCNVDTFLFFGPFQCGSDTMRLCFLAIQVGVCQLSIWPLTDRSLSRLFIGQGRILAPPISSFPAVPS